MKVYNEKNVFDAAMERIEFAFDNFDNLCVSYSGGKDISEHDDEYRCEYGWYEDSYYDLCEECDDAYHAISDDMRKYRNEEKKKLEKRIEKEVKRRIEMLKKGGASK